MYVRTNSWCLFKEPFNNVVSLLQLSATLTDKAAATREPRKEIKCRRLVNDLDFFLPNDQHRRN